MRRNERKSTSSRVKIKTRTIRDSYFRRNTVKMRMKLRAALRKRLREANCYRSIKTYTESKLAKYRVSLNPNLKKAKV